MRLWTFQSEKAIELLKKEGILNVSWQHYKQENGWKKVYQWIASEMQDAGINCKNNAPIWAWHSCNAYGQAPSIDDARALISDIELEMGIQTIELECPDELVMLTRYGAWNKILDHFIDGNATSDIPQQYLKELYNTNSPLKRYQAIQATLPYLQLDWVLDIRPLKLKAEQYEGYDEWELV